MKSSLSYKGFVAAIEFDGNARNVSVEIQNVQPRSLRPFKIMSTIAEAEEEFHAVIDEYIANVTETGFIHVNEDAGIVNIVMDIPRFEYIKDVATNDTRRGVALNPVIRDLIKNAK